jgi:hypothetical protein
VPDPTRFPDGMPATADYVHGKGLLFGIYTARCVVVRGCRVSPSGSAQGHVVRLTPTRASPPPALLSHPDRCSGSHTCAGKAASCGHEALDAATFASWGVECVALGQRRGLRYGSASGFAS